MSNKESPCIQPTYIADLFRRYMRAYKLKNADVAKVLGCSAGAIAYRLRRADDDWRVNEINDFCLALNCPVDLALKAQVQGSNQKGRNG